MTMSQNTVSAAERSEWVMRHFGNQSYCMSDEAIDAAIIAERHRRVRTIWFGRIGFFAAWLSGIGLGWQLHNLWH